MNIKKAFLTCALLVAGLTASAQCCGGAKAQYVFNPHWYIQLQPLGGQYTLGETSFSNLTSYNVQGAVGYEFNPIFGLRLAVNGWQSRGGSEVDGTDYKWKYKYVSPTLDLTFNLSNLFCGYNPKRFFNFSVLAGAGANIAWGNDEAATANAQLLSLHSYPAGYNALEYLWDGTKTRLVGQTGAIADFRVSDRVSFNVELQANVLGDHYNSKKAKNPDWYFNALAGVTIKLGKLYTQRACCQKPAPQEKVIEKVIERVVEKPVPAPAPAVQTQEVKKETIRRDIFFGLAKTNITEAELTKVQEIADFMKAHADSKLTITGYADKGTGNAAINARLSARRAQAVTDALVKTYGIEASRISYNSKGDTEQPYTDNAQNRVSICIAE